MALGGTDSIVGDPLASLALVVLVVMLMLALDGVLPVILLFARLLNSPLPLLLLDSQFALEGAVPRECRYLESLWSMPHLQITCKA